MSIKNLLTALVVTVAAFLVPVSVDGQWSQNVNDVSKNPTTGNVGIGTSSPTSKLDIDDTSQPTYKGRFKFGNSVLSLEETNSELATHPYIQWIKNGVRGMYLGWGDSTHIDMALENGRNLAVTGGNVGIGITTPGVALEVAQNKAIRLGNANLSSGGDYVHISSHAWYNGSAWQFDGSVGALYQISGQTHTWYKHNGSGSITNLMSLSDSGNLTVSGSVNAKYQDVAEWVPSSVNLAAGTVVVLDSTKSNQVIASSTAYDTRVAGVISEQPGIALGEKSVGKVLVATTGRVKVKVDASKGAIRIGDLLVTSDTPGVAMKSEPIEIGGRKMHMPGTLIGKALEPLAKGSGEILVLLSLQ